MVVRLSIVFAGLVVGPTLSHPSVSNTDRVAILKQSHRLDREFEEKRLGGWRYILAPNFRSVAPGGEMRRKGPYIADAVNEARSAVPPVNVQIHYIEMARAGDAIITKASEHTCYGVRSLHKALYRLCYRQQFAETWHRNGSWRLAEVRYLPGQSFELDGKLTTKAKIRSLMAR